MVGELITKISTLSYLFTEESNSVVAHCLELDLVAAAKTREIAERRLDTLVRAQIRTVATNFNFADLSFKAPQEFWDSFYEGQEFKKVKLEIEVPPMVLDVEQKVSVPVFMRARVASATA